MGKRKRAAPAPVSAAEGPTGSGWHFPVLAAGCGALAAAVYSTALHGPFVYDDFFTVVDNPTLREPGNVLALILWSRFRPLVNVSYAIDAELFGFEPFGFHLGSLLLHSLNTVLVAFLARAAWKDGARGAPGREGLSPGAGWPLVPALLFAVHPMLTQAVSYIAARSELLSTFFALLSLLALRRAFSSPRVRWAVLGALALLAALASKESAAAVPVVALLWSLLLLPAPSAPHQARTRLILWALVGLVAAAGVGRVLALALLEGPLPRGPLQNLAIEAVVLWRYLGLFLVPHGQTLLHGVREVSSLLEPRVLASSGALAAVAVALYRGRRALPLAVLGAAWFLLFLLPSSVVPLNEPMSEHRAYGASIGLFLGVTFALRRAALAVGKEHRQARVGWVIAVLGVVVLTPLTLRRNRVWADPVRLWTEAVEASPRIWAAQFALGQVLSDRGDCAAAQRPWRAAIALVPEDVRAHNLLARCLSTLGQNAEAFALLDQALRQSPASGQTWANLAALAVASHRPDKAREFLERALALEPGQTARQARLADLKGLLPAAHAPWPPSP